jgi:hypothetical protein
MEPYASLDMFKEWLGVSNTESDSLLRVALGGATEWINTTTGRRFNLDDVATPRIFRPAGRTLWTDDGLHKFIVDDIGDVTGMIVETGTTSGGWTAVTDYELDPENALAEGWPVTGLLRAVWPCTGLERLRVTTRWGWPAIHQRVIKACLIQGSRLFRRKDSPEGVLGGSEWGVVRVGRADPDAAALIDPLCLPGFG